MSVLTHCSRCDEEFGKLRISDDGTYHEKPCEFCGLMVQCQEPDANGFPYSLARHDPGCEWIKRFTAYIEGLIAKMG